MSKPTTLKKKRATKASRKADPAATKEVTPPKRRPATTVKKQKSVVSEANDENTFDRPDPVDVSHTTNSKQDHRRQTKDANALYPMTPLKDEASGSKDAAQGTDKELGAGCGEPSSLLGGTPSAGPCDESKQQCCGSPDAPISAWLQAEAAAGGQIEETIPSEGGTAPKRRRRTRNQDSALLAGNAANMSGAQREELNKLNERKLEDSLEEVMRETLTQEELFAKIERGLPTVTKCKGCKCRKGLCLKRYCECLRNNATCGGQCACRKHFRCGNLPAPAGSDVYEARKAAIAEILKRKPDAFEPKVDASTGAHTQGCSCKNSKCQKAYCECYERGVLCTDKCKC